MGTKQSDMRQRVHNNASDVNRSIQHSELLDVQNGDNDEEDFEV